MHESVVTQLSERQENTDSAMKSGKHRSQMRESTEITKKNPPDILELKTTVKGTTERAKADVVKQRRAVTGRRAI